LTHQLGKASDLRSWFEGVVPGWHGLSGLRDVTPDSRVHGLHNGSHRWGQRFCKSAIGCLGLRDTSKQHNNQG
jgi:hypothetical protein